MIFDTCIFESLQCEIQRAVLRQAPCRRKGSPLPERLLVQPEGRAFVPAQAKKVGGEDAGCTIAVDRIPRLERFPIKWRRLIAKT
ncbi:hypothetical protein ACFSJ2_04025 [Pseudochelatococcus lubricantis]